MADARWKVKPKGFATIKKGGYWVKPQASPSAPLTSAPTGGTAATSTRTAARNKLQPREYVGSEGVIGSWKSEPRLNPDQYEWTLNPENNRWFARPRNELTGLDPQSRADVGAFDRTTGAQQQRVQEVYDQYATQAGADRDAGAAAFGSLAKLSGAGYQAPVQGQASGPYGAVQGASLAPAQAALPGVMAQGAQEGSAAQRMSSLFGLSQLPTLARAEGATALERYTADRTKNRGELIGGYRQQASESAAAAAEQKFNQQKLAADLRGQNLTHLGKVLSGETQVKTASIRANTARDDRSAKLLIEAQKLRNQADIARENNNTKRSVALMKRAEVKEKEAAKAKGPKVSDQRAWAKRAREMWDGIPRSVTDEQGNKVTEYLQYDVNEIIRELQAQGASRGQAIKIARQISGNATAGAPATVSGVRSAVGF